MRKKKTILTALMLALTLGLCACGGSAPVAPAPADDLNFTVNEPQKKGELETYNGYLENIGTFPISFTYEGNTYKGFGDGFRETDRKSEDVTVNGVNAKQTLITLAHTASGATFTLDCVGYPGYGAYEWTVSIANSGNTDTGVFSAFNSADMDFEGESPRVSGISGDGASYYLPYSIDLTKTSLSQHNETGRPTHGNFPYYNLSYGNGGTMIAVGWPGRWRADFTHENGVTNFKSGLFSFASYLKPGESVRMPLQAFVEYEGRDEDTATNAWRRWFIDCNLRKTGGETFKPATSLTAGIVGSMSDVTNAMLAQLKKMDDYGIEYDYLWIDAGWYTTAPGAVSSPNTYWPSTGTIEVNTSMFPDKFKSISDALHAKDAKLMLWFEPESMRIDKDIYLAGMDGFKEEWLWGKAMAGSFLEGYLMNLSDPDCVDWIFERISSVIDEGGVDMYRQDFNMDPATVWNTKDTANRKGVAENEYVCGYLSLWDKLIARYPDMMIDSCASGGGRLDLETMRRSVPLHFSDMYDGAVQNAAVTNQRIGIGQELSAWLPYYKGQLEWAVTFTATPNPLTGEFQKTMYSARANYAPWFSVPFCGDSESAAEVTRKALNEWNQIKDYYYGNYYRIADGNKNATDWKGWEYVDPAKGEGFVQLFRPAGAYVQDSIFVPFYDLDESATYTVTDTDGNISIQKTGAELMENGIAVTLPELESSAVLLIKKAVNAL